MMHQGEITNFHQVWKSETRIGTYKSQNVEQFKVIRDWKGKHNHTVVNNEEEMADVESDGAETKFDQLKKL